jgi:hypothetical protein
MSSEPQRKVTLVKADETGQIREAKQDVVQHRVKFWRNSTSGSDQFSHSYVAEYHASTCFRHVRCRRSDSKSLIFERPNSNFLMLSAAGQIKGKDVSLVLAAQIQSFLQFDIWA